MDLKTVAVVLAFSLTCLRHVTANSSGAPVGVCASMMPGHGVAAQAANTNPYMIMVDGDDYYMAGQMKKSK